MLSPDRKKNNDAGFARRCRGAGIPPAQVQHADNPSNTRPASIESTKSVEEQCSYGYCGSAEQDIVKSAEVVAESKVKGCASRCCSGSAIQGPARHGDNTIASARCGSGDYNDLSSLVDPEPVKEKPAKDGCAGGNCSTKSVPVAIEGLKADNCNDGCCGTTNEVPIEDCNDGCCGSVKLKEARKVEGKM
jgi:hypothetical protein